MTDTDRLAALLRQCRGEFMEPDHDWTQDWDRYAAARLLAAGVTPPAESGAGDGPRIITKDLGPGARTVTTFGEPSNRSIEVTDLRARIGGQRAEAHHPDCGYAPCEGCAEPGADVAGLRKALGRLVGLFDGHYTYAESREALHQARAALAYQPIDELAVIDQVSPPEDRAAAVAALDRDGWRRRLAMDFASLFPRIRGAHNPHAGEPCAWCQLAAEQAAEAVVRMATGIGMDGRLRGLLDAAHPDLASKVAAASPEGDGLRTFRCEPCWDYVAAHHADPDAEHEAAIPGHALDVEAVVAAMEREGVVKWGDPRHRDRFIAALRAAPGAGSREGGPTDWRELIAAIRVTLLTESRHPDLINRVVNDFEAALTNAARRGEYGCPVPRVGSRDLDVGRLARLPTLVAIVDDSSALESMDEIAEILAREYASQPIDELAVIDQVSPAEDHEVVAEWTRS